MRDQINKGKHLSTPLKQKNKTFFQGGETINMKQRKIVATLLAFAMVLSLVVIPVGTADAATTYGAVSVPQVGKAANTSLGTLKVTADPMLAQSEALITLPSNSSVVGTPTVTPGKNVTAGGIVIDASFGSAREFKVTVNPQTAGQETEFFININANTSSLPNGDVVASITGLAGQLPSGAVTLATIGSGSTTITTSAPKFIAGDGNEITITLTENQAAALKQGTGSLKLRLPVGFTWNAASADPNLAGDVVLGFGATGSRDLSVNVTTVSTTKSIVRINAEINADDSRARYGDVVANITGTSSFNVSSLTVAKYSDFGVQVSAKDVEDIVAGTAAAELGTLVIEETSPGSIIENRSVYLKLPAGVKWRDDSIDFFEGTFVGENSLEFAAGTTNAAITDRDASSSNDRKRTLRFIVESGSENGSGKIELENLKVDVGVGFTGPIEVEVFGNAGVEGKAVVGEVTSPVTVTAPEKADVRVGVQNQDLGTIVIDEAKANSLKRNGVITIKLTNVYSGQFDRNPTVTVLEGDIEVGVRRITNNTEIEIRIDNESTVPSKIEVSGIRMTLDRSVPEGDFTVTVAGNAVAGVNDDGDSYLDNSFSGALGRIAQIAIANVTTPAPGQDVATPTSTFVIDSSTYTVGGVEKVMDVAPFIQDGRTMLPVRFVAEALGVSEDNIIWNAVTKQVTIMKGDRIAQMTIGSNVMLVNGVSIQMDTAAAVKDGRTVLPVRFVAQALGANIAWDDATRTVTVN